MSKLVFSTILSLKNRFPGAVRSLIPKCHLVSFFGMRLGPRGIGGRLPQIFRRHLTSRGLDARWFLVGTGWSQQLGRPCTFRWTICCVFVQTFGARGFLRVLRGWL